MAKTVVSVAVQPKPEVEI